MEDQVQRVLESHGHGFSGNRQVQHMGHWFNRFEFTGSSETATRTAGFHSGHRTRRIGPPLGSRIHRILSGLIDFSPWIRRSLGSRVTNHCKSAPPNSQIFLPPMNLSFQIFDSPSLSQYLISHSLAFSLYLSSLNLKFPLSVSLLSQSFYYSSEQEEKEGEEEGIND